MSRPVTLIVLFFVALNAIAGVLVGLGIDGQLGLNSPPESDKLNDRSSSEQIESGAPTGQTLFGMYNVLAGQFSDLLSVFTPGLNLMVNAGMPAWIRDQFLIPLFSTMTVIAILSFLRGWGL